MKTILTAAIALLLVTQAARAADAVVVANYACNLSDISSVDQDPSKNPNIVTKDLALKVNDNDLLGSYKGKDYYVGLSQNTGANTNGPSYELMITGYDSKTKAVVSSVGSSYSLEQADVLFQPEPGVLINCMPLN